MNIIQFIKGAIKKMIRKSTIETQLNIDIAVSSKMEAKIREWSNIYENNKYWFKKWYLR